VDQDVAGAEHPLVGRAEAHDVRLRRHVAGHGSAAPPDPTTSSSSTAVRAKTVTRAPRRVSSRATAAPMPRPPPVTMAVLPSSRPVTASSAGAAPAFPGGDAESAAARPCSAPSIRRRRVRGPRLAAPLAPDREAHLLRMEDAAAPRAPRWCTRASATCRARTPGSPAGARSNRRGAPARRIPRPGRGNVGHAGLAAIREEVVRADRVEIDAGERDQVASRDLHGLPRISAGSSP